MRIFRLVDLQIRMTIAQHCAEPTVSAAPRVGRNDPCFCGSGKKYKKCCLGQELPS